MAEPPKSYDEIVRRTVPEPDTSWRPSPEQTARSAEGIRESSQDEQALLGRIQQTLADARIDIAHLQLEIDREQVTVRGEVARSGMLAEIENLIARVPGVETVVDLLVVA